MFEEFAIGRLKSIRQHWIREEKLRFLAVGAVNTFVGYMIFTGFYLLFGARLHYLAIALISHFTGVVVAFYLQRRFVFHSRGPVWLELFRYNVSLLTVLGAGVVGLYVLVTWFGFHPLISQAVIVLISAVLSYILHRRYSFQRNRIS